jgi:hypothetical protein
MQQIWSKGLMLDRDRLFTYSHYFNIVSKGTNPYFAATKTRSKENLDRSADFRVLFVL